MLVVSVELCVLSKKEEGSIKTRNSQGMFRGFSNGSRL
jgi:hypothetical protein